MIKIGVIGLGKMGVSHLSIINQIRDVNVVGICDTSKIVLEGFKQLTSFKTYSDYEFMLEKEKPDGVIIATPSHTHYEIAKKVLTKGIHLFIEKPFSLTFKHAKELAEIAKIQGVVNQVGYHNRFIETFRYVKRLLENNVIGEIYHFEGQAYGPAITKESKSWRVSSETGGGCLYDYGSHVLNLISFLVGEVKEVKSATLKNIYSKSVEDFVNATIVLQNNISGVLNLNWSDSALRRMTTQIFVWGKGGKIIVDSQEVKVFVKDKSTIDGLSKGWNIKYLTELEKGNDTLFFVRGEEYSKQLEYFVDKIKNNDTENINGFNYSMNTNYAIDLIRNYTKEDYNG